MNVSPLLAPCCNKTSQLQVNSDVQHRQLRGLSIVLYLSIKVVRTERISALPSGCCQEQPKGVQTTHTLWSKGTASLTGHGLDTK